MQPNSPSPSEQRFGTLENAEFLALHEIIAKARINLHQNDWDYVVGGGETETTVLRNRMALDELAFRPRVLRNVSMVDPSRERFGRKLRLPIILAPVGGLEAFDPGAGSTVAQGAGDFGVAHMLSSACKPGLEAVAAAAPDALRIFQLYVRGDDAFVDDHVKRAQDQGYTAFCVTVDNAVYSRRERDIVKRFRVTAQRHPQNEILQAACDWAVVDRIRERLKIPLILKGIATVEDAVLAVEHGADWVYVSNHGGRQLDCGLGSMEVLPEIVEAVAGRAKIIVDGSICRGTDVVKAIASGADLVGMGRMQCYALAAAGRRGIVRMLELIEDEVRRALALLGVNTLDELDGSFLRAAKSVGTPHVLSAFPLLNIPQYRY